MIKNIGIVLCWVLLSSGQGKQAGTNFQDPKLYDPRGIVARNAQLVKLGDGYNFTEGPATDKDGNVYFTDQPNDRIIRWDARTKTLSSWQENMGRSNGMYFDGAGNLITCADLKGEIWSIDPSGKATVLVANFDGKPLNGPNDLWIAPNGAMYITDPLYSREYWAETDLRRNGSQQNGHHVYYLSPDRKTFSRVEDALVKPNGVVGTPDGRRLYVSDIDDSKVYMYDIQPDGNLTNRTLFCAMKSDGMTIDSDGNIYLTNELGVTAFDKSGEKIFNVSTGERWTANVVFGGTDRRTLFITAMGSVYALKMNVSGVR